MFKRIITFILIAAMLSLTSCSIVGVIDHGTTAPEETTEAPKEYSPWGFWYSYENSTAISLVEDENVIKLYSLSIGYYEYYYVDQTTFTREGDTFQMVWEGVTYTFTFDKFANTLTMSNGTNIAVYKHMENAPEKHPNYSYPDYTQYDPSLYITLGDIDLTKIAPSVFEGAPYNIAVAYYKNIAKTPVIENIDRPVKSGDVVNIDYCGKLDGVAFKGGTATGVTAFVSDYDNKYIPGFTDGIIGHSVGETFDVNVTFPEVYPNNPDLAGKAVVFTMTLNSINDLTISDENVEAYTGNSYKTYTEWLRAEQMNITTTLFKQAITAACAKIADLPEDSYMYYYQQTVDYYHMVAYYYNIPYEQIGLNESAVLQSAMATVTYNFALYWIAKENDIAWTTEDYTTKYEAYVSDYLKNYTDASQEDAREYADKQILQIKNELTEEAVLIWAFDSIFASAKE